MCSKCKGRQILQWTNETQHSSGLVTSLSWSIAPSSLSRMSTQHWMGSHVNNSGFTTTNQLLERVSTVKVNVLYFILLKTNPTNLNFVYQARCPPLKWRVLSNLKVAAKPYKNLWMKLCAVGRLQSSTELSLLLFTWRSIFPPRLTCAGEYCHNHTLPDVF